MSFKLPALALMLSLCGAGPGLAHDMQLEGSEWGVVGDDGASARFVSFAGEHRVFGFSGCNRFSGEYLQGENQLTVKPSATTQMACAPENLKREEDFLTLLGRVRSIRVEHTMLMLLDDSGAQLTTLIRRGAP